MAGTGAEDSSPKDSLSDAETAFLIYSIAFLEVVRQVHIQCIERGELLLRIWRHLVKLFQDVMGAGEERLANRDADIAGVVKEELVRVEAQHNAVGRSSERITSPFQRALLLYSPPECHTPAHTPYKVVLQRTLADSADVQQRADNLAAENAKLKSEVASLKDQMEGLQLRAARAEPSQGRDPSLPPDKRMLLLREVASHQSPVNPPFRFSS